MAKDNVLDLDILRPSPRFVRIGGKEIDVSFIPCGMTFDIDTIVQELARLDQKEMAAGGEVTRRAFDLSIKLCATFCSFRNPELDEAWFRDNTDAGMLNKFADVIKETLERSYQGVEAYQKN